MRYEWSVPEDLTGSRDDDAGPLPASKLPELALDALAHLTEGVLVLDRDMRVVVANTAARSMNLPLALRTWAEEGRVWRADERTPFPFDELPYVRALAGALGATATAFVRCDDGRGLHVSMNASPLRDDEGDVCGAVCVLHDIGDDVAEKRRTLDDAQRTQSQLEACIRDRTKELAEAQERLVRKERLAVLGQVASGVAHQIRNPLAAIMNATYVLERHLAAEPHAHVRDAIGIIHDEVRHANSIITGLLEYARHRVPNRHPTSIAELLARVLDGGFVPENVVVERHLDDVPRLDVDPEQIHGAIFAVVRNAVEAMPNGGVLRVEARVEGAHVVIAITDSGPGISSQVRDHLFEPLHSTKPTGLGLGLVTARTFVEAHGGKIARVDVADGTCFEMRLPLTHPA